MLKSHEDVCFIQDYDDEEDDELNYVERKTLRYLQTQKKLKDILIPTKHNITAKFNFHVQKRLLDCKKINELVIDILCSFLSRLLLHHKKFRQK